MKKLTLLLGTMIFAFALVLTACGNDDNNENGGSEDLRGSGALTIYSNSLTDEREEWLQAAASEAGFDVNLVGMGGGDLINRLVSERNNPVADVVFGSNHVGFETLRTNDVLTPFTPVWADEIAPGMNHPDGYYHSTIQQAIVLVYNEDTLGENAPSDLSDLWTNEAFHGQYFVNNDLSGGTIRMQISGILYRYRDDEGTYGISDEGWEAIAAYFNNATIAHQDDTFSTMVAGDVDVATLWTGAVFLRQETYGLSLGIVEQEIGVPFVVEQVGIINGTDNQELAEEFINWFGSAEVQSAWANEFNQFPANLVALEEAPQELIDIHATLTPQEIDWVFVTENIDDWMLKIELDIMP